MNSTKLMDMLFNTWDSWQRSFKRFVSLYRVSNIQEKGIVWASGLTVATAVGVFIVLAIIWSFEPDTFDVKENAQEYLADINDEGNRKLVTGFTATAALIEVADTMMSKTGGFISNDIMPPGILLDNMPNWEKGVLTQVRDLVKSMRNDYAMAQTTSTEDEDLKQSEPAFNNDRNIWILPSAESKYDEGNEHLRNYLLRLSDPTQQDAQFYARADNLVDWLSVVEKRLGSLSQRLSASVGQERINTDLAGDSEAQLATPAAQEMEVKTPWMEIDDVFYEARGTTWALIHFMHAAEVDFEPVLKKKNALVSLKQIIRELEATQQTVWSPIILNGSGFGMTANHSLVMASYISRANAAIIDLKRLLRDG